MANTVSIKLNVNAKPAIFAAAMAGNMVRVGIPAIAALAMFKALAWVRISTDGEWPWQGWKWIGDMMEIETNG